MGGYSPLKVTGFSTGLVQQRENFLLPDDGYPVLQNAYLFRERIKRKKGFQLLGRLQRAISLSNYASYSLLAGLEATASLVPGSLSVTGSGGTTWTDNGQGVLVRTGGGSNASINYATGVITPNLSGAPVLNLSATFNYYPGLPVMGICKQELANSANDQTIFFDQVYAYIFDPGTSIFKEFIPGTTWNAAGLGVSETDFFWSTNYWISNNVLFTSPVGTKLFWETNGSGHSGVNGDPPRITDGTTWLDFYDDTLPGTNSPWAQIDATPTYLINWLCNLPYRGRMVVFNTWEGANATGSINYSNRIRWSTIGNPFIAYFNGSGSTPSTGSWRDDIRGQGGFLDIPTSEDIISIGFVRDNLVIYCERSTWQLRYTGRAIAPFQIERVNAENGAESTFASVQFDTSLVTIGDKGIIECDSYKANRIDIKIPDFVFQFNSMNNGVARVQGIRDFENRLAYWTIPLIAYYGNIGNTNWIFPTARLVYNYENDSWALFNDSLTALGNYQQQRALSWVQIPQTWRQFEQSWLDQVPADPLIVGGNQQGFIEQLDLNTVNDVSLFISDIVTSGGNPTEIISPNHNMQTGFVIGISGIIATTPGSDLNGGIYAISVIDLNKFSLLEFNPTDNLFDIPVVSTVTGTYIGGGLINIRENFYINSKKFNFLDEGQNIQLGYLDILMPAIPNGEISLNVYLNYDDLNPSNTLYGNQIFGITPPTPDTFFNTTIPTSPNEFSVAKDGTKFWQRVFCPTRANFLTLQYTFSNLQMSGIPQTLEVQIDAQVLWIRRAGRLTNF